MTNNVRAAWRSGGLHYTSCEIQTFISAQNCLRGYCRHYAKPPVPVAQLGKGRKNFYSGTSRRVGTTEQFLPFTGSGVGFTFSVQSDGACQQACTNGISNLQSEKIHEIHPANSNSQDDSHDHSR